QGCRRRASCRTRPTRPRSSQSCAGASFLRRLHDTPPRPVPLRHGRAGSTMRPMHTHRIALYPGDGIGPEVVDATVAVLDTVARQAGDFALAYETFDWGIAHYDRHGR